MLRALWGTAPEDDEVAGIIRKALDGFKAQGAEVVDVSVPGFDELIRESSVIGASRRLKNACPSTRSRARRSGT